jgi:undecaprenyl-diphosphatase
MSNIPSELISVIALGALQGITEFLPVSSSGHLVLLGNWLQVSDADVTLEVFLHGGTLLATLFVFYASLFKLFKGVLSGDKASRHVVLAILITCIPTAILGKLFEEPLESLFASPKSTCVLLLVTGCLLYLPKWLEKGFKEDFMQKMERMAMSELPWSKAFLLGIFQALAILPGISRSGTTITAGILMGLKRKDAGEYSFLISIPVISGVVLLKLPKLGEYSGPVSFSGWEVALGVATAFVTGYFSLKVLMRFVQKGKLHYFAWYCWGAGLLGLVLL